MKHSITSWIAYSKSFGQVNWVRFERLFRHVLILGVAFYRAHISSQLIGRCIYYPTCSQYALEALNTENPFKALRSIVCRILRCHPLAKGGFDPFMSTRKQHQ